MTYQQADSSGSGKDNTKDPGASGSGGKPPKKKPPVNHTPPATGNDLTVGRGDSVGGKTGT